MKIETSKSFLNGEISIPGSKSHTIRALIAAMLADGESIIKNPLTADDPESCLFAIKKLGCCVSEEYDENNLFVWKIKGNGGIITNTDDSIIHLGNSGTSLRLLTGACATSPLKICFDGDDSLRGRPMGQLISSLEKLGAKINSSEGGKCPLTVKGAITGGETTVVGTCSQFVSSLLFSTPLAKQDTVINVLKVNEKPYIDITLGWLDFLNIKYQAEADYSQFRIKGNQKYTPFSITIPADFSTASFPLAAAAITGGKIKIMNIDFTDKQGDKEVFDYFERMGTRINKYSNYAKVSGTSQLLGDIEIDMNNTPDGLPIMAVAACFAKGKTILSNAEHARIKETDRIKAMKSELKKMGADIEEKHDGLIINYSKLHGAVVNGHSDHRIIMSLAIAGMASDGVTIIENASEISVTYPNFINDFKKLGANIKVI